MLIILQHGKEISANWCHLLLASCPNTAVWDLVYLIHMKPGFMVMIRSIWLIILYKYIKFRCGQNFLSSKSVRNIDHKLNKIGQQNLQSTSPKLLKICNVSIERNTSYIEKLAIWINNPKFNKKTVEPWGSVFFMKNYNYSCTLHSSLNWTKNNRNK